MKMSADSVVTEEQRQSLPDWSQPQIRTLTAGREKDCVTGAVTDVYVEPDDLLHTPVSSGLRSR
jgi:hypothetical protein